MITRRNFTFSSAAALAAGATPTMFAPERLMAGPPKGFDPTPQEIRVKKGFEIGEILIQPSTFYLYLITEKRKAMRYGVGVGKAGLEFAGSATINAKREWPSWRPTQEMINRSPRTYRRFVDNTYIQPGGPDNPLGARALYLYRNGVDTYFRIHGTNQPQTIGTAASNGCFRMMNDHVVDLYERVPLGTKVRVI